MFLSTIAVGFGVCAIGLARRAKRRWRWFVTSTIIGATTMEQLKENLSIVEVKLDKNILSEIDAAYARYPNPTP
jgi:aryl-alcohol dehydrogenase-like predicted oxidoreductase